MRSKTDEKNTCPACIETQAKIAPFKGSETNRYASLEAVSSVTTGPLSQADICGNKYLQLIVDAGTGWTTGEAMQTKASASDVILRALARLQLACETKVKRLHTDGAQEQYNDKLKKFLEEQGTIKSTTAPHSSSSNAFVERRMGIVFAAARAALKAAPAPLDHQRYWSFSALDAIDKANFLPLTRNGSFMPSPHTALKLHGHSVDEKDGPNHFLPYGQPGWIVNTARHKKKLEDRSTPANYLRCTNKEN